MIHSASRDETIEIGRRIADSIGPGTVIALEGDLGSGKTTLVKGIARGLGIEEEVTSPTFIIISEYSGNPPLYHMDLYRIGSVEEFEFLGAEELLFGDGICVIEWSERIRSILPPSHINVTIEITGPEKRILRIKGIEV